MLIKNYGLHWNVDRVFWGRPAVDGTLLGVPRRKTTSPPTDFRDQRGVYVLNRDFRPIYVGQTGSGNKTLFVRLRDHRKDHLAKRWDSFSWFGLVPVNPQNRRLRQNYRVHVTPKEALNHLEAVMIAVLEPPMNLQRGRFDEADQYLQAVDTNLPASLGERIDEILEAVRALDEH